MKAHLLVGFFDDPNQEAHLPRPFGIFFAEDRFRYEEAAEEQVQFAIDKKGEGDLAALLRGENVWKVD